jgi:hypothetical protein
VYIDGVSGRCTSIAFVSSTSMTCTLNSISTVGSSSASVQVYVNNFPSSPISLLLYSAPSITSVTGLPVLPMGSVTINGNNFGGVYTNIASISVWPLGSSPFYCTPTSATHTQVVCQMPDAQYTAQSFSYTLTAFSMASSQFSSTTAIYQIIDCGEPATRTGYLIATGPISYKATRSVYCVSGYEGTPSSITCGIDSLWSTPTGCAAVDCGEPSPPLGYTISAGTTTYLAIRTVSCASCYDGISSTISCQVDRTWTSPVGCYAISCGTPPAQTGYNIAAGYDSCGASRTTSCATGYSGSGASITCQASTQWSAYSGCTIKSCSNPEDVSGYVISSGTNTYQSVRTVTCNSCFVGTATSITCQDSQLWSLPSGCAITDCGSVPAQTGYSVGSGTTTCGSVRTVTCSIGYSGTPTDVTCQSNLQWTSSAGCSPVSCGEPVAPTGYSFTSGSTVTYGTLRSVSCQQGFYGQPPAIQCQADQTWTQPTGCNFVDCGQPSSSPGYVINSGQSGTGYNAVQTVSCESGYSGTAANIVCQQDLTWSSSSGCTAVACPTHSTGRSVPEGCVCEAGYSGSVSSSSISPFYFSTCSPVPCPLYSSGSNVPTGCSCSAGYSGTVSGTTSSPFYISSCSPVQCPLYSSGIDVPSGCTCNSGFSGSVLSTNISPFFDSTCMDIDECQSSVCDSESFGCKNTVGHYACLPSVDQLSATELSSMLGGEIISFRVRGFDSVVLVGFSYGRYSGEFDFASVGAASIASGSNTTVQAVTSAGYGASMRVFLSWSLPIGQTATDSVQSGAVSSAATFSYPAPTITPQSLHLNASNTQIDGNVAYVNLPGIDVSTWVTFSGTNFGNFPDQVTINYLQGGTSYECLKTPNPLQYPWGLPGSVTNTEIVCRTATGESVGSYTFQVAVAGVSSNIGVDRLSFPAIPNPTSAAGCSGGILNCPTLGGVTITIFGEQFSQGMVLISFL